MRTILYNPIFINPQAYYVFPQLYDVEKGDSFIEPAIYSGYLLIEDLISNTSSQVTDTREVDFTQFAGKRIRISQYTNIGAVVLGEWLLPEGEPSGPSFHQSLVDAWFMSGPSNSDKPSSITGVKGNDLALKNFAYSFSSGFGKYNTDFNSWKQYKDVADFTVTDSKIHVTNISILGRGFVNIAAESSSSFEAKIEGISDIPLWYQYYNSNAEPVRVEIKEDGIYTFPKTVSKYFDIFAQKTGPCNITITQLPTAYEGALVFDGVDDYGICSNLPILTDYTVICRRSIITVKNASATASKRSYPDDVGNFGAFVFERTFANGSKSTYSFGATNGVDAFDENEIIYQTKTSYNGKAITSGSSSDSEYLCLGANAYNVNLDRCQEFSNIAVYYFALYDKSLTPEEIEEEKVKLENYWEGGKNELA